MERHVQEPHERNRHAQEFLVQSTVVGQIGVNGIPVVNPVVQVCKKGLGAVHSQRPCTVGNLVRGNHWKIVGAIHIRVPLTVLGQVGVPGRFAASLVEMVLRSASGTARSQRPVTAGKTAKEMHRKSMNVTHIPAR